MTILCGATGLSDRCLRGSICWRLEQGNWSRHDGPAGILQLEIWGICDEGRRREEMRFQAEDGGCSVEVTEI